MDRWRGKVAIVTGASAGIGAAIATALVKEGLTVVGLARRKQRMIDLAENLKNEPGKMHAIQTDIMNEDEILNAMQWIKNNLGPVHILINNAGITRKAPLIEGDTAEWKKVMDTNVMGLCVATREVIKDMRANKVDGHIIHINSVAGHYVLPISDSNMYGGSKYAVTALTDILRRELVEIGSKIKITSLSPGYVETEIFKVSNKMEQLPMFAASLQSEDVAQAVLYVLGTPPHVQVHELMIKPIGEKF